MELRVCVRRTMNLRCESLVFAPQEYSEQQTRVHTEYVKTINNFIVLVCSKPSLKLIGYKRVFELHRDTFKPGFECVTCGYRKSSITNGLRVQLMVHSNTMGDQLRYFLTP